ncbi:MAG: radical SAM protein [Verrucomicrobiaceae bacterium]|nr:MAG: radical SAM protein [Verrucomicrobiaceae bacterium]
MVETMDAAMITGPRVPVMPPPAGAVRPRLAMERVGLAERALTDCGICQHRCGANRLAGPAGRCGAGADPHIFSSQVEVGDEWEIIPAYAVALSGCSMRCAFCITGDESWHPRRGQRLEAATVADWAAAAIADGRAQSLLVLGGEPTIHLPWLLRLVAAMPEKARLVLKTNGLSTDSARVLLEGLFDVWIVDFKFGNDGCAWRLSRTADYTGAVRETLLWGARHTDLIIRHLLMPGHVECCWRQAAAWIASHLPGVKVSLRSGYWPAWRASLHNGLNRPLSSPEQAAALETARHFNLRLVP